MTKNPKKKVSGAKKYEALVNLKGGGRRVRTYVKKERKKDF
jgi:hypothetical protein